MHTSTLHLPQRHKLLLLYTAATASRDKPGLDRFIRSEQPTSASLTSSRPFHLPHSQTTKKEGVCFNYTLKGPHPKQGNSPSLGAQHHPFSPPAGSQMLPCHQQSNSRQVRRAVSLLLLPGGHFSQRPGRLLNHNEWAVLTTVILRTKKENVHSRS